MMFRAKSPKRFLNLPRLAERSCPFSTSVTTLPSILTATGEVACLLSIFRLSRIGMPALIRIESRFAKMIFSWIEKREKILLFMENTQHFADSRDSGGSFCDAVFENSRHALAFCDALQFFRRRFAKDCFTHRAVNREHFMDAYPAAIAASVARVASFSFKKCFVLFCAGGCERSREAFDLRLGYIFFNFAFLADFSYQSLSDRDIYR